ncbi:filamentous hemagglutinin N-terminal domain-containing protein [Bdellovibrio sp. HCB209]|uniref:two-partner secretion domain-containing protein n=1 Tax=Bdellovibrio sp. HCB209 TaxID=3394354 RepID=UPI0039B44EC9
MKNYLLTLVFTGCSLAISPHAIAQVVGTSPDGSATISPAKNGEVTIKVNNDRSLINLTGFSLKAGERVVINQPSPKSVLFLRMEVQTPIEIHGHIKANGRIFLINPEGITLGPQSNIAAAGVFVTTADMKESDFQVDEIRFEDDLETWGQINTQGLIRSSAGGFVSIIGDYINTNGTIEAGDGSKLTMMTAAAFNYSLIEKGVIPSSIRPVSKKAKLLDRFMGIPVIQNLAKLNAEGGQIEIGIYVDYSVGGKAALIWGNIKGAFSMIAKVIGQVELTRVKVDAGSAPISIDIQDDLLFTGANELKAGTINVKAGDELNSFGGGVVMDTSSTSGNGGNIRIEGKKLSFAGILKANGAVNGGNITVTSPGRVDVSKLKTEATGKSGKPGVITLPK